MKNKWFKLFLCVALVAVLCCVAALAEGETPAVTAAAEGATVTVNSDVTQFTQVKYNDVSVVDANQYVLLIVKADISGLTPAGSEATAAEILAGATANTPTVTWDVGETTILYIDQKVGSEVKGDGFQNFAPKSFADAVILLGGTFTGEPTAPTSPVVIGAIKGQGVAVSGEVTSYKPGDTTTIALYDAEDDSYSSVLFSTTVTNDQATSEDVEPETQEFSIPGVTAGTYNLVVTKPGNLPYIIKGIEVGSADIDLTQSEEDYAEIVLVSGNPCDEDDYEDQGVDGDDFNALRDDWEHEETDIENAKVDFDGSLVIDGDDLNIMRDCWEKTVAENCIFDYVAPSND